jgi:hypothetical protein
MCDNEELEIEEEVIKMTIDDGEKLLTWLDKRDDHGYLGDDLLTYEKEKKDV